ncbi:hypothetical protein NC653_039980 [Populus alba x Populus x berolinensis]|uniref:Uncharacterized protein n=1 Tax=Populus alba x Populus x berolinensis TaxID=444605 RepID=A0AAD6LCK2_9ROSI|nr:hypothetical protein NC653_039980 [Populus alba x Populus x berolinensis]
MEAISVNLEKEKDLLVGREILESHIKGLQMKSILLQPQLKLAGASNSTEKEVTELIPFP